MLLILVGSIAHLSSVVSCSTLSSDKSLNVFPVFLVIFSRLPYSTYKMWVGTLATLNCMVHWMGLASHTGSIRTLYPVLISLN